MPQITVVTQGRLPHRAQKDTKAHRENKKGRQGRHKKQRNTGEAEHKMASLASFNANILMHT